MSALNADVLAGLRAGLIAGLNAQTVQYKIVTGGTAGTGVDLRAIITVRTRGESLESDGRTVQIAETISVRPVEDETLVIGDIIVYDSQDFHITSTSGTDVRRLECRIVDSKGIQRRDRFRAENG